MPNLERCEKGCEPCACKGMADRPHCMYCLNDLTPEMEAEWRKAVETRKREQVKV